ncbi:MAG: CcmD family protein [Thermodesulfobacteriota bacterium]
MARETYVIFAYLAIWGGLLAYLTTLARRQYALARKVEALAAALTRKED